MTIREIQSDEALRRKEFPVAESTIFLSHAGVCPLPFRVSEAIRSCAQVSMRGDQEAAFFPGAISRSRELAARLLGCKPAEIALVGPTSVALSLIAAGVHVEPGDNVVIYFDDYPSNVYPWMNWAARGVEIRRLQVPELGEIAVEDVLALVDPHTRLVALASCHFISGQRIDIDAIGRALHDCGVLFCVDGIQTLGAFSTSVRHVDFLAADAHKWMLGPCAAGLLYVSEEAQDRLRPILLGWHNVQCPNFVAQEELVFRTGAQRYEAGTHNLLGVAGINAAMELLLEVGVENIGQDLLQKRALLRDALVARGWEVLRGDADPRLLSGIVSFRREGQDMAAFLDHLRRHNVVTALRSDRQGRQYIRVSPHFYNTDSELMRMLELL